MKLVDTFDELRNLLNAHGVKPVEFDTRFIPEPYIAVDDEIPSNGLTVDLREVKSRGGLLSYHGRQVLLYMQKHSGRNNRFQRALEGDEDYLNKYHLCECKHIVEIREHKQDDKYVITEDLSGRFYICGEKDEATGQVPDGYAELKVCKNCLEALNYRGSKDFKVRQTVYREFNLSEFFCDYGTWFDKENKRIAGNKYEENYTPDWKAISFDLKEKSKWQCEECRVDFKKRTSLLHVHHINGVMEWSTSL